MGAIVDVLADAYPKAVVAQTLDALKNRCFRFATKSGLTVSIDDVRTPADKQQDPRRAREAGREGRGPVPQGRHHRR